MTLSTAAPRHASARLVATLLVCFSSIFGVCTPAAAQVEPIEPTWMVAARDAPLRCGELSTFYKVADLERGDVVRVDGRSSRWARVIYPAGQVGYVRNEDAEDVRDGTLTVGNVRAIKAPNQISGMTGSWKSIYSIGTIEPGTRLTIVGQAEAKDGQRVGYRVAPPMPPAVGYLPYGYVQLAALRDATAQEIEAHLASLKPATPSAAPATMPESNPHPGTQGEATPVVGTDPVSTDPVSTDPGGAASADAIETDPLETPQPSVSPATEPTGPAAGDAAGSESTDTTLIEDMAVPTADDLSPADAGDVPAANDEGEPQAQAPTQVAIQDAAVAGERAPSEAPLVTQSERDYLLWSELEQTLTDVRRKGGRELEDSLNELIAEYERSLTNADTPAARAALASRLEWLRVRKAARDQRLEIQATIEQAKQLRKDVSRERLQWQTTRGYDIVGRLVTSAIYDGTRLPRMYRIVTEGETGLTRTIGYVRDDPSLNLQSLLGSVVGVAGRSRLDDALRLRVITPTNIDRFQAAAVP